jgi:hypothetical protein
MTTKSAKKWVAKRSLHYAVSCQGSELE